MDITGVMTSLAVFVFVGLMGSAQGQSGGCSGLIACTTPEIKRAFIKGDQKTICRLGKSYLECTDNAMKTCDNEMMKKEIMSSTNSIRTKIQTCEGTTYSEKKDMQTCGQKFAECLTPELQQASAHEDTAELCRKAPGAIQCMEQVLKRHCPTKEENMDVKMIASQIDTLKRNLSNAECMNTGRTIVMSTLLISSSLAMAVLLQKL